MDKRFHQCLDGLRAGTDSVAQAKISGRHYVHPPFSATKKQIQHGRIDRIIFSQFPRGAHLWPFLSPSLAQNAGRNCRCRSLRLESAFAARSATRWSECAHSTPPRRTLIAHPGPAGHETTPMMPTSKTRTSVRTANQREQIAHIRVRVPGKARVVARRDRHRSFGLQLEWEHSCCSEVARRQSTS
jgi:hypothetical protein